MTAHLPAEQRWTPATRMLTTELPDLVSRMSKDGFEVYRVMFNPADWDDTPARTQVDGRTIKLGWFRSQDRDVITVVDGSGRNRVRVRNGDQPVG